MEMRIRVHSNKLRNPTIPSGDMAWMVKARVSLLYAPAHPIHLHLINVTQGQTQHNPEELVKYLVWIIIVHGQMTTV